ncbi:molybdate ABC transporter substrate-binding protein [Sphingomonas sp. TDK1]|uniref:molybdate ABC transporter substrate-binding protein n=1 Tax=Sphingomonas sp. TDK1 TaxID=453247 RepID=UPI0007DA44E8|nr:molybdate ABC transporter substrate-binding protein [Sphingomonas sp. TDK1]OAN57209.1 molybdate ABC transporter substrate-binding protein [Sphingomonas sp. TDK1]
MPVSLAPTRRWAIAALVAVFAFPAHAAAQPPLVLAAASLQESMNAAADAWARMGHARPVLSFAASSALARQIQSGAPADLFVSADEPWMDAVDKAGKLAPGTRLAFLGTQLVLAVPVSDRRAVPLDRAGPLLAALGRGRLAMADPDAVPAGLYGKAALQKIGAWDRLNRQVARAENVRAALALVERGAAPFGIVYATDARASAKVRIAGVFPANSHPPIRYPIARLKTAASPDAEPFRRFLVSARGKAIFARYGFTPL